MKDKIKSITGDAILGMADPLKTYIELKDLQEEIGICLEALKEDALTEARKYHKDEEVMGKKLEIRNSAGKWKFDHVQEWNIYKANLKSCEERLKHAYKAGAPLLDEETGEVLPLPIFEAGKEILILKNK